MTGERIRIGIATSALAQRPSHVGKRNEVGLRHEWKDLRISLASERRGDLILLRDLEIESHGELVGVIGRGAGRRDHATGQDRHQAVTDVSQRDGIKFRRIERAGERRACGRLSRGLKIKGIAARRPVASLRSITAIRVPAAPRPEVPRPCGSPARRRDLRRLPPRHHHRGFRAVSA